MIYINSFQTEADVQSAIDDGALTKPYVVYVEADNAIDWNTKFIDYSKTYLTFNIISGGTIYWVASDTAATKTIEYKLNDREWTSITSNTGASAPSINVVAGDIIQFRGNNASYGSSTSTYSSFSGSTAGFEVEGNIMSVIDSTNYSGLTTLSSASMFTFCGLFRGCTGLTSTENLVLPATTLIQSCYHSMFYNCGNLLYAPKLPATTLANSCYYNMFFGCTSLTTAPVLPATTLSVYCYRSMFQGCANLNYIKCLATDISATSCTSSWVKDVQTTSGTFVKNTSMSGWSTGNNGIPNNWTSVDA